MRLAVAVLLVLAVAACGGSAARTGSGVAGAQKTRTEGHDWTRFGWDARRSNDAPIDTLMEEVRSCAISPAVKVSG